jgi:REP element-mobilizing transposase RayT
MIGLLTWPAYGTWFATPERGWIDRDRRDAGSPLAEPTRHADGREPLKWPPVHLDHHDRDVLINDLVRVAELRGFRLSTVVATPDHVHVLLDCDPDRDVPRLVQQIKGALSRALTVAAGDRPARSTRGETLVHHKWWTRQYSFRWIGDSDELQRVAAALAAHAHPETTVWTAPDNRGE